MFAGATAVQAAGHDIGLDICEESSTEDIALGRLVLFGHSLARSHQPQVVSSWFGAVILRRAVWLWSGVRCCLASYSWYHGVVLQEGSG
ncbi:hypothetical protein ACER0C_010497 [Sarotherodon galilaeus]